MATDSQCRQLVTSRFRERPCLKRKKKRKRKKSTFTHYAHTDTHTHSVEEPKRMFYLITTYMSIQEKEVLRKQIQGKRYKD